MVIFLMCITLELMGITICFQRTANLSRPFDQGFQKTVGPRELLAFKKVFCHDQHEAEYLCQSTAHVQLER